MSASQMLRVCLLVDDQKVDKYVRSLASALAASSQYELGPGIIRRYESGLIPDRGLPQANAWQRFLLKLLNAAEQVRLRHYAIHRNHLEQRDWGDIVKDAISVHAQLDSSDLSAIAALGADLIIHCGAGAADPRLAALTRLGVLSIDFGGARDRGGPLGFWPSTLLHPQTGFAILYQARAQHAPSVVLSGLLPTHRDFLVNQAALYAKAFAHVRDLALQLANEKNLATRAVLPDVSRDAPPFSLIPVARYLGNFVLSTVRGQVRHRLAPSEEVWTVAFAKRHWRGARFAEFTRIVPTIEHYYADPFLVEHDGRHFCFVEDYVYGPNKGRITVFELKDEQATELGVCLDEPFHMSYPFLFHYNGELYMCPEACASRSVRVYRCVEFPLRWELAQVLMDDVSATDTILFEQSGRWWMLTNLDRSEIGDHSGELYAFHADHPLSTNWVPHRGNPIQFDPVGGRNGGLILRDGEIIRCGQRQGISNYGEGLCIHRINVLNEDEFRQERLQAIDPDFVEGLRGIHHLTCDGTYSAYDLKFVRSR